MDLDFSPRVTDSAMEGFYSPSLTCILYGFSPQGTDCIALPLGVSFGSIQVHSRFLREIDFE